MFEEVFLRKNQFTIHTVLSFFAGLCLTGVFLLFLGSPSASACDCVECDSTYSCGSFRNDVATAYCNGRNPNFSGGKTLTSGGNATACLPNDSFVDSNCFLIVNKSQAIGLCFNLNCEFIACTSPPRAGPARL